MPPWRSSTAPTLRWEALLLVVPMLALVGFGVLALGWERRAEREELRARCRALVGPLREDLQKGLEQRNVLAGLSEAGDTETVPVPGEEGESLERFREEDFGGVLGGASSQSAAGLPLRPLAALRLLRVEHEPKRLEELTRIMAAEPSIVTPRLLAEAEERHRALGLGLPAVLRGWEERLDLQQDARRLLESEGGRLLGPTEMIRWIAQGDRLWLVLRTKSEILVVEKEQVKEAVRAAIHPLEASLPPGVHIDLLMRGPDRERAPVLMEASGTPPIRFVISDPTALRGASAGRRLLFISYLSLAGLLSAIGIVLLVRTAARERELSERKGNLVAAVSHEMRTPVASIRLLAENLHSGLVSEGDDRERHLDRLVEQSERLSTLVENVLSYSKREAGKEERRDVEIDVEQLLLRSLAPFRVIAESQGVVLSHAAEDFAIRPQGDAAALQEALVNLIDNALKHSPEAGEVVCAAESCAERVGWWRLSVADQGPGVEKEEQEKIFEAFYRVGSELRRETTGTGLGLALVRQVAKLHGGEAHYRDATATPQGARFELLLPLIPPSKNS